MTKKLHLPPLPKMDFLLCTFNPNEKNAVDKKFGFVEDELIEEIIEGGNTIQHHFTYKDNYFDKRNIIGHLYFRDKTGKAIVPNLKPYLNSVIQPDYIIATGTAGAIKNKGLNIGDVVVSNIVHMFYASNDKGDPRESPAVPSDPVLVKYIDTIKGAFEKEINDDKELEKEKQKIQARINILKECLSVSKNLKLADFKKLYIEKLDSKNLLDEIEAVLDELIDNKNESFVIFDNILDYVPSINNKSKILIGEIGTGKDVTNDIYNKEVNDIMSHFKRTIAYEMEGGVIASEIFDENSSVKYVLIKGISDLIFEQPQNDENKKVVNLISQLVRKITGTYVTRIASEFIDYVLYNFSYTKRKPIKSRQLFSGLKKLEEGFIHNDQCAGVIENVEAYNYSKIASQIPENFKDIRIFKNKNNINNVVSLFTVFTLSPHEFYELANRDYKKYNDDPRKPINEWAVEFYEHFSIFKKFYQDNQNENIENAEEMTARILILNSTSVNSKEFSQDVKSIEEWNLFYSCVKGFPCWIVGRDMLELRKIKKFISDYAIVGDELLLEWDESSKKLTISDLMTKDTPIVYYLTSLRTMFRESLQNNEKLFIDLREFSEVVRSKFLSEKQSYIYPGYKQVDIFGPIRTQKKIQADIIKSISLKENISALFVGCGYGDEIQYFSEYLNGQFNNFTEITAIDIDKSLSPLIHSLPWKQKFPQIDFKFIGTDLLLIADYLSKNTKFDLIQCGFVLHDIPFDEQAKAIKILFSYLKMGGLLLISEIFLNNQRIFNIPMEDSEKKRRRIVSGFYDLFIEHDIIQNDNFSDFPQFGELKKGLVDAKKGAINGFRDFYRSNNDFEKLLSEIKGDVGNFLFEKPQWNEEFEKLKKEKWTDRNNDIIDEVKMGVIKVLKKE